MMEIRLENKGRDWYSGDIIIVEDREEGEFYYYLVLDSENPHVDFLLINLENCEMMAFTNWKETFGECILNEVISNNEIIITRK